MVMYRNRQTEAIELAPGEIRDVGIQFDAPASIQQYAWTEGTYRLQSDGLDDTALREPEVEDPFDFTLAHTEVGWIHQWSHANDEMWVRLNDPDNAVGIPVPWQVAV